MGNWEQISAYNVPAPKVASVSGLEVVNSRYPEEGTRLVRALFDATITFASSISGSEDYTVWLSRDNGANWLGVDWYPVNGTTATARIDEAIAAADETWKFAAKEGRIPFTASTLIPDASMPAGVTRQATGFLVPKLGLPNATLGLNPTPTAGAGGSFPYNAQTVDGNQFWLIPGITINLSSAFADPKSWVINVTFTDIDASGHAIGPEHIYGDVEIVNGSVNIGELRGEYGKYGDTYTRVYPYPGGSVASLAAVRAKFYASNRADQTTSAWSNPAASTLQTDVASGAGYLDITVAVGGAIPAGKVLATRIDSTSWGSGIQGGSGVAPSLRYGGGTQDDGSGNLSLKVGSGIVLSLGSAVVNNGPGLGIDGFSRVVPNTGNGLSTSGVQIIVSPGNGISTSGGQVAVNPASSGGLTVGFAGVSVNVGNGVQLTAGIVSVQLASGSPIANSSGLTINVTNGVKTSSGSLVIDLGAAGGLTLSGTTVVINPGTGLSVGTSIGIANGGVGPTQISSVNFAQLNTGTMNVGSGGATFSGTGGIVIAGSGGISVLTNAIFASAGFTIGSFGSVTRNGSTTLIDSSNNFVGAGVSVSGGCGALGFNPTGFTGASATIAFKDGGGNYCSVEVGGTNLGAVRLHFVNGIYVGTI
jgi:hypothetical protein